MSAEAPTPQPSYIPPLAGLCIARNNSEQHGVFINYAQERDAANSSPVIPTDGLFLPKKL